MNEKNGQKVYIEQKAVDGSEDVLHLETAKGYGERIQKAKNYLNELYKSYLDDKVEGDAFVEKLLLFYNGPILLEKNVNQKFNNSIQKLLTEAQLSELEKKIIFDYMNKNQSLEAIKNYEKPSPTGDLMKKHSELAITKIYDYLLERAEKGAGFMPDEEDEEE